MKGFSAVVTVYERVILYPKELSHFQIKIYDKPDQKIDIHFENVCAFIDEHIKKGHVLVHCFGGFSSSASIIIAYLMKKKGWSLEKALEYVKARRNIVNPNPGFMAQLKTWEKKIQAVEDSTK